MENPQINPINPQMPVEKSNAGANLAIVVLVLVIVVVGVKLLMSGNVENAAPNEEVATETENAVTETEEATGSAPVETTTGTETQEIMSVVPGKGQAVFSVSSSNGVIVRQIFVHNPFKTGASAWVKVYDGYKSIPAGATVEVFTASLAAITYDMVRISFLSAETGVPDETTKTMPITVTAGGKTGAMIQL